jgi:restriction endonuclease S subunit
MHKLELCLLIHASDIGGLPCKLPAISEQKKIAEFLKALDNQTD